MAKLHTREIVDYEKSCRPTLSDRLDTTADLRMGDHIHWCQAGSWRDGIIIEVKPETTTSVASLTLVRYGHVVWQGMKIQQEEWKIQMKSVKLYKYEYCDHCHPPSVVVTRAKRCIGYGGYNALRNNNEDFCRWSKSGKHTYLCINEIFLLSFVDKNMSQEDDTYVTVITTFDDLNEGDHISWLKHLSDGQGINMMPHRHGIVLDVDQKVMQVVAVVDRSLTLEVTKIDLVDLFNLSLYRHAYERCHMPEVVTDRARSKLGLELLPEDSHAFARWCKLGIPIDCEAMETNVIPAGGQITTEDDSSDMNRALPGITRASVTSLTRTTEEAVASMTLNSAARQAPRALVRGTTEGVAAAAAVGVEAVILATDVILTYHSFKRKLISKDSLLKQNIQSSVRSVSAASGSIGAGVAGAALGSVVFPGIGTLVGGVLGGVFGGIAGQFGGHFMGGAIASFAKRPYENMFVEADVADQ